MRKYVISALLIHTAVLYDFHFRCEI